MLKIVKADEFKCQCGSTDFYEGPHGGLAVNVKCVKCGKLYNIVPLFDGNIGIDTSVS